MKTKLHTRRERGGNPIDKVEFANEIADLLDMEDVDRDRAQHDIAERDGLNKGTVSKYYREAKSAKAKSEAARSSAANAADIVPDGSDQALAVLFVQQCGKTVRYIAKFGQWLTFDGV